MIVISVVGARPQFVKAAVVSRQFRRQPDCSEILVHTGQHYDKNMSDVFFAELGIPHPDHHLGIGSGSHGQQTGRILESVERVLLESRPDWVIVYGDTNSTLAAAVAAVKLQIPVAHVEAGLRSFNRQMPEEINRVLTDHAADLLLAPSEVAVQHLQTEGISGDRVRLVGDVMYDATLHYRQIAEQQSTILSDLGLSREQFVLATVHRAENTDDLARLNTIVDGLIRLSRETPVVIPLHPRTRAALERTGLLKTVQSELIVVEPVGYLDMLRLETEARCVATDSGGVQKEAFFCGTRCVTLRDETEWVELVELGWNQLLSPARPETFAASLTEFACCDAMPPTVATPYGNGRAAEKIVAALHQASSIVGVRAMAGAA